MKDTTAIEKIDGSGTKIVIVGVGGAGINMLDSYITNKITNGDVKTMAIDERIQDLDESSADIKVKLEREELPALDARPELELVKLFKDRGSKE